MSDQRPKQKITSNSVRKITQTMIDHDFLSSQAETTLFLHNAAYFSSSTLARITLNRMVLRVNRPNTKMARYKNG